MEFAVPAEQTLSGNKKLMLINAMLPFAICCIVVNHLKRKNNHDRGLPRVT